MDIEDRLRRELQETAARIRSEARSALGDDAAAAFAEPRALVDAIDGVQQALEHEMVLATRSRLHERARQLAGALERLRDGRYGVCEECGDAIAPARLVALPEVATCVACQSRRESAVGRFEREPASAFADVRD